MSGMGPPAKKIKSKTRIFPSTDNNSQNEGAENKSSQCIEDGLRIPLILRIILQNLWDYKLLELSLVSKLWLQEARTILRDRGTLTAKIKSKHPCQDLKAFASDLQRMNVVPFSGLKIDLSSRCNCDEGCVASEAAGLNPSYDVIRARLQFKILDVTFNYLQAGHRNCPAFQLVSKTMANFSGVLESLSLKIEFGRRDFIQEFLQHRSFPRLRTLRLYDRFQTESKGCANLIKALVSSAPNLKTLFVYERVDLTENLMKGSTAHIEAHYVVCPTLDDISDCLVHKFRMTRVQIREMRNDLSLERNMVPVTLLLLEVSRSTLRSMDIDAAFLVPLKGYGIRFENVTQFKMHFNSLEPIQPGMLSLIKTFDFKHIFPRLTKVKVFGDSEPNAVLQSQIMSFIEQWNPPLSSPGPDVALNSNIKALFLHFPDDRCPGFLPEMFPHVERLHVSVSQGQIIPKLILEGLWQYLKELDVDKLESNTLRNANLDSILCGIFPEEIAELRGKDHKYLKAMNLVPVMPSLVGLKGLNDVTFRGAPYVPDPFRSCRCYPAFMYSRVAGFILANRCPSLVVGLVAEDYKNSNKLETPDEPLCKCRIRLENRRRLKSFITV